MQREEEEETGRVTQQRFGGGIKLVLSFLFDFSPPLRSVLFAWLSGSLVILPGADEGPGLFPKTGDERRRDLTGSRKEWAGAPGEAEG